MGHELIEDRFRYSERRRMERLIGLVQATTIVSFVTLLCGFWSLQVGDHERLLEIAENNHQRQVLLRAPRGVVFDRNGNVLVENRYSLNVSIVREDVENLAGVVRLLAEITGIDESAIKDNLEGDRKSPLFRPTVVIPDASLAQVSAVTARKMELTGVVIEHIPSRYYPSGHLAAHSIGYVGEITEEQLGTSNALRIRRGDIVGQTGIEKAYNQQLMGTDGVRHVVVNSVGREIGTLSEVAPIEGQRIQLTLDYDLQKATEDAFENSGFDGAAVVLDPNTGEILSLVSIPSYDPNFFVGGIDNTKWQKLTNSESNPLQNRALQGRYPPGSTFKLVTAVAALEDGLVDREFSVSCHGGGWFYGRFFRCNGVHGQVTMQEAIAKSCNTFFYTIGAQLDVDRINGWIGRGFRNRPAE